MNALQHRDYETFDSGISIIIRPAEVEIWNSGSLPEGMTVDDLKRTHHSRPHNPGIANVFFLRGYVERIGSGSTRIVKTCHDAGLPEPEWREMSGGISLRFRFGTAVPDLNERQLNLVRSPSEKDFITAAEYRVKFTVSERQARAVLSDLVKRGSLQSIGSARSPRYRRTSEEI